MSSRLIFSDSTKAGEDQLTLDQGALLLLRRANRIPQNGERENASEADYLQAIEIVRELGGHPLALDQAGAYIEETQCEVAAYLSRYLKQKEVLLNRRGRLPNEHPNPVTTTLELTFERIGQLNTDALELLRFLAFLSPEALPDEMLLDGAPALTGPLHTLTMNPAALDEAMSILRNFSLVHSSAESRTLTLQRIVQTIIKEQMTRKQQSQLATQAVYLVNATFPEVLFATRELSEQYLPQALHCASLIRDFQLTLSEGALLLERLGFYYSEHGCYAAAETYLTQALEIQQHQSDVNPLDVAQTRNSLGLNAQRQARYDDAIMHHQRARQIRERVLNAEHPKIAESLHNLALVYGDLGEYQEAEQLYQQALAIEERAKGANSFDVARTLNNLGLTYYHQGKYAQAEEAYQRTLAIYDERLLPAEHPARIHPLDGLGALAEVQDDYQQAEELYRQERAICEQALGEMHPETAHSINKLADIAEERGDYEQAEALYQQALSIAEQVLGPGHPDVALFLNDLGFLRYGQKQYQQAADLYLRALSINKQALGAEHPEVASGLNNLGQLAHRLQNEVHAEELLRQALAIYEQRLGPMHPDTAQALSDLADVLVAQGRHEEAEPLYRRALTILRQVLGPSHADVTLVREKYASLLELMNRNEEAAKLRQEAESEDDEPPTNS